MVLTSPQYRILMEEVLDEDLKKTLRNIALAAGLTIPTLLGATGVHTGKVKLPGGWGASQTQKHIQQGLNQMFKIKFVSNRADGEWAVVYINKNMLSKIPSHKKAHVAQMYLKDQYPQNWALQKTSEQGDYIGFAFLDMDSSPQALEAIQSARQDMGN